VLAPSADQLLRPYPDLPGILQGGTRLQVADPAVAGSSNAQPGSDSTAAGAGEPSSGEALQGQMPGERSHRCPEKNVDPAKVATGTRDR
jgi:hypothetical protein